MNWIAQFSERRRLHRELGEEIRGHIEERAAELVAEGMSRADALIAARRAFGNATLIEESGRDVWRWSVVEDFFSDIRFALRQLRQSPAFALSAALTLALGIGANTAMFSLVNAVVLRPLPFPEPEGIVSIQARHVSGAEDDFSYPNFFDFRQRNRVFEHMVSYRNGSFVLTGGGRSEQVRGLTVSWELFPMLGVQPALGRGFLPEEEKAGARVVVLSHQLWTMRFGADPALVGKTISIDRIEYTVAGVAPKGFRFPAGSEPVQLWTTLAVDAASGTVQPVTAQRGARLVDVQARLKRGVTIEQAQAQMDAIAAAIAKEHPGSSRNFPRTYVKPELERMLGSIRRPILILQGAVGLVLLIACANIANLLLARGAGREREFALRASIGAGRGRILRQVATEGLTLSLIGCAVGLAGATWLLRLIVPLAASLPRADQAAIDGRVLAFSAVIAILTGVTFSIAPALRVAGLDLTASLKAGSRSATDDAGRMRNVLVIAQIALGLVLLSGASLLISSFVHLMRRDPGFQTSHLVAFHVSLPGSQYSEPRRLEFYRRLKERLNGLPGVESSTSAMPLPLTGGQMNISFNIEERPTPPHERPYSGMAIVDSTYFQTLGVPLREGRFFTDRDDADALPVLIVNRAFAEKFFPGQSAIGKRIEPGATSRAQGTRMREIVGVVGNARPSLLKAGDEPIYYFHHPQLSWCCGSILVRASGPTAAIEASIRGVVASIDSQLAVHELRTVDQILAKDVAGPRFQMLLLGGFAATALLLTLVGLYGLLAYSVARQTREIGVRMALGAARGAVAADVLKRAMLLVLAGIVVGLPCALGAGRLIAKALHGVTPGDPRLLAVACGAITLTAIAAALLPARRAASIDPMTALRSD